MINEVNIFVYSPCECMDTSIFLVGVAWVVACFEMTYTRCLNIEHRVAAQCHQRSLDLSHVCSTKLCTFFVELFFGLKCELKQPRNNFVLDSIYLHF